MLLKRWDELPECMRTEEVRPYYNSLKDKTCSLLAKRIFDFSVALVLLILISPVLLILAAMIKLDSKGPIFFRQIRVTQYGRKFRIWKFRTMVNNAEEIGTQVTVDGDLRITRIGKLLRGCRLDELPQLLNILSGDMSFVGTRPEVPRYVAQYTPEMWATLLLPAGVTSEASILYKEEAKLFEGKEDTDRLYVEKILPAKMVYCLKQVMRFSFLNDIKLIFMTVIAMLGKEYKDNYKIVREKGEN